MTLLDVTSHPLFIDRSDGSSSRKTIGRNAAGTVVLSLALLPTYQDAGPRHLRYLFHTCSSSPTHSALVSLASLTYRRKNRPSGDNKSKNSFESCKGGNRTTRYGDPPCRQEEPKAITAHWVAAGVGTAGSQPTAMGYLPSVTLALAG